MTILILDDQRPIAELLGQMLALSGHESIVESDAFRALDLVTEQTFDLVISDFRMPEMNGHEFFRVAVSIRPEIEGRFILLTGDIMNEETHDFVVNSGVPYFKKPFTLASIDAAIAKVFNAVAVVS